MKALSCSMMSAVITTLLCCTLSTSSADAEEVSPLPHGVNVVSTDVPTNSIRVVGSVKNPGYHLLSDGDILTVSEAIMRAGGLLSAADGSRVVRLRSKSATEREVKYFDVKTMFESLDFIGDDYLRPGDLLIVPTAVDGDKENIEELEDPR